MEIIYFLYFLFLAAILGWVLLYSYWYGITPTPTMGKVKKRVLSILPEMNQVRIAELGSGWGHMAFALVRRFPTCEVRAYEISPIPFAVSKLAAFFNGYSHLVIHRADFFQVPLNEVSLVVCYLYPGAMLRLKSKFENELSDGAYVVSHTFAVPGWQPIRIIWADDLYRTPVYLYQYFKN